MKTRITRLASVALLAVMLAASAASAGQVLEPRGYPPIRQTLTQPEKDQYLAAMRIGWIEVDSNSDAKPTAICFQDHLTRTTPLTAAPSRETTQVVLRFFSRSDFPEPGNHPWKDVVVTVLLLNDEVLWQGHLMPYPGEYNSAADSSCQFADTLASQLRDRIRQARTNLW